MDSEASGTNNVLERMILDENAEPMNMTLSLLEDITSSFSLDHQIGRGGFAVVYKGTVGKSSVAVKKLTKTHELPESKFHKEVECLMKAKHRNIVRFLGYCAETQGTAQACEGKFVMADMRNWLLCFEYVPNGSLENYITDPSSGLEWKERFGIIIGICHGLQYLHNNRILHLDLKPANILLDDRMQPKISDFGLSRCLDIEQTRVTTIHMSGTLGYMAPEYFGGKVSFASDIYSLGIVIVEILTGGKGYPEEEDVIESWRNRLEGVTQFEQVRVCTKIVRECTETDPKRRPVASQIIDMLGKTTSADETGMNSSVAELEVNVLKGQFNQQSIRELNRSLKLEDINEWPENEDVAECLGTDHSQEDEENTDDWSLWEAQDKELKGNNEGTSVLGKLNVFKMFKRSAPKNSVEGLKTFTMGEMKKITNNYSALIGRGRSGNVYLGTLPDTTIVAVSTLVNTSTDLEREIINGVQIEIRLIHKNILKFIGCCLEDVPMLVHEFSAHGSVQEILHGNKFKVLSLELRLDIATGSAEGIRYMHSIGMLHGDVNPDNILLDEQLTPKIAQNQASHLRRRASSSWRDYMDPMYMNTGLLTEKSDVYSFGVVLMELITRKKISPVEYCKIIQTKKSGRAIFDKKITTAEDMSVLEELSKLALECVKDDTEERPDMTEVAQQLVMIKRGRRFHNARNAS